MDLLTCIASSFESLSDPGAEDLGHALSRIPNLETLIQPYIKEPDCYAYGRNVVYSNETVEVIVINLPPSCSTAIHDHGDSVGCAIVVEGELANIVYQRIDDKRTHSSAEYIVASGQFFFSPAGIIHQMSNRRTDRMVSLHAYSPPLRAMKTYDRVDSWPVYADYSI